MGGAIARGVWTALAAAVLFGVTTPLVKLAGLGVAPLATAALLYFGAALAAAPAMMNRANAREAPLRMRHAPRLVWIALFGAAIAPSCLAWGLARTSAEAASLLLNLEAIFTVLLARAVYREAIGARVATALTVIAAGGALLVFDEANGSRAALAGSLAVVLATFAWALDNVLTRALADVNPASVVFWKGMLGAASTAALAFVLTPHDEAASWPRFAALAACGATGYGASLRLYLRAQRQLGAARTGSIFAAAPFVGAAAALAIDGRAPSLFVVLAGLLCAVGVALHLTEHHEHAHTHEALVHEHAHRHDDGHHAHTHDAPFVGDEHNHVHRHEPETHAHEHAPDLHHDHGHD